MFTKPWVLDFLRMCMTRPCKSSLSQSSNDSFPTAMNIAAAKRFVQEGMDHVFITGRNKGALDSAVTEIGKNVTDRSSSHRRQRYGSPKTMHREPTRARKCCQMLRDWRLKL